MVFKPNKDYLIISIILMVSKMIVKCDEELCRNPIYTIDRFNNNTVRLFHENYYWDLNGFPEQIKVSAKGSMKDYEFLNPVKNNTKIVTILEGSPNIKGRTYKFENLFWWSWRIDPKLGVRYLATEAGLYWDQIPKDHGFDAVFHNGDKKDPMIIGLESNPKYSDKNMKIHFFSTKNDTFIRKPSKYFNEKDFPNDMTDAFSWPPTKGLKYMVYILKNDKYCILSDKQKCTEWKSFRKLYGCPEEMQLDPGSTSPLQEGQYSNQTANPNEEVIKGTISGIEELNTSQQINPLPNETKPEPPTKPTIILGRITTPKEPEAGQVSNSPSDHNSGSEIVFSLLSIVLSFVSFILI